ncbi:MAG TPA: copper chaperone PCu(A)C [Gammaproteobacteria bacterium]|nr:copper chaperone PCu(A)C [Gammaproteobacteria bacterium]
MRILLPLFAALLCGCAPDPGEPAPPAAEVTSAASDAPAIRDAWIRPVPPGARMTAGYLSLHNPGPEPLVVVGVESPLFGSIEMHGTVVEDGMARMRHQETVTVAPGETVRFEPGGLHLMLMQAAEEIPASGTIELSLLLEGGERLDFAAQAGQPGG